MMGHFRESFFSWRNFCPAYRKGFSLGCRYCYLHCFYQLKTICCSFQKSEAIFQWVDCAGKPLCSVTLTVKFAFGKIYLECNCGSPMSKSNQNIVRTNIKGSVWQSANRNICFETKTSVIPFDFLIWLFLYRTFLQSCSISQLSLSQAGGMLYSLMNRSQLLELMRLVPFYLSAKLYIKNNMKRQHLNRPFCCYSGTSV